MAPKKKAPRCCAECLTASLEGRDARTRFCSDRCKARYKNRKMVRAGDAYDLLMAWRFDRKNFDALDGRTILARMVSKWKQEDDAAGRKSADEIGPALVRLLNNGKLTVQDLTTDRKLGLKKATRL